MPVQPSKYKFRRALYWTVFALGIIDAIILLMLLAEPFTRGIKYWSSHDFSVKLSKGYEYLVNEFSNTIYRTGILAGFAAVFVTCIIIVLMRKYYYWKVDIASSPDKGKALGPIFSIILVGLIIASFIFVFSVWFLYYLYSEY